MYEFFKRIQKYAYKNRKTYTFKVNFVEQKKNEVYW